MPARFIEIETVYDDVVSSAFVNPDKVRYVRPAIDEKRTVISFAGGGYVMSRLSPGEVAAILSGDPKFYGEA